MKLESNLIPESAEYIDQEESEIINMETEVYKFILIN